MKKLVLVFATIAITAGAYAQSDSMARKMNPSDTASTYGGMNQSRDLHNNRSQTIQNNRVDKSHPDGVMIQNGKVLLVKNGQKTILDRDLTLSNGTKIMSDGTWFKKDGTKVTLKEGQHIDMAGNLIPMKTNKDKNMYLVPNTNK